ALVAAPAIAQMTATRKPSKRLQEASIQSAGSFSRALLTRENSAEFKANLLEGNKLPLTSRDELTLPEPTKLEPVPEATRSRSGSSEQREARIQLTAAV